MVKRNKSETPDPRSNSDRTHSFMSKYRLPLWRVLLVGVMCLVGVANLNMVLNTSKRARQVVFREPGTIRTTATVHFKGISLTLVPNTTYNETYNLHHRCKDRTKLPEDLGDLLQFTSRVSTRKKILFMGDSVSLQLSQIFEEAAGSQGRRVIKYSWERHEGIHVANVNGGGVVAGYRILHLLRRKGLRKKLPNFHGGGWRVKDAQSLLNFTTFHNETIGRFDVLVFRIPHGWIRLSDITEQNLYETVEIAGSLFGVKKVIFVSVPFTNNVQNEADLETLEQVNNMVRTFVANSSAWNQTSVDHVAILELGNFVQDLVDDNGRRLGMNVSGMEYRNQRCCTLKGRPRSIPLICSELVDTDSKDCTPNAFSLDGMHYCFNAVGGRMVAGISCLIGCDDDNDARICEQRCNDQFMSLAPIF